MAGKLYAKNCAVKCFILTTLLLVFSVSGVGAQQTSSDLKTNAALLTAQCGYVLSNNMLHAVSRSDAKSNDSIASFNFYVSLKPVSRKVSGKLSFGCFSANSTVPNEATSQRLTAAQEIVQADSGGRYARGVVWQRKYEGKDWVGTIAYVNSVFGDQEKLGVQDFFLICPTTGKLACFSFEVEKRKLSKKESDGIPRLLGGVGIRIVN